MKLRRRSLLGGIAALVTVQAARAATPANYETLLRSMFATPWRGVGGMYTDAVEGGRFEVGLLYQFNLNSDMTVSGTHDFISHISGAEYRATYAFEGEVWVEGDAVGVRIEDTQQIHADSIPDGFYWQGWKGSLTILNNSDSPGKYVMDGTMTGMTGGDRFDVKIDN